MNLAKTAIERPIWVAVSVVLIFLLGLLSIRGCLSSCSRHRPSPPQHLGELAFRLAPGDGVGSHRSHRAGDAGGAGAEKHR